MDDPRYTVTQREDERWQAEFIGREVGVFTSKEEAEKACCEYQEARLNNEL